MAVGIYPGSFDPITNGHLDVLNRALDIFDKVIVLIAVNPKKTSRFSVEERKEMIKEAINDPRVEVDSYDGLTVEYAKRHHSKHLIRGLRAVNDFEYELQLVAANNYLAPEVDTVFLMSKSDNIFINSSTVIEMHERGIDVSGLVPQSVLKRLKK